MRVTEITAVLAISFVLACAKAPDARPDTAREAPSAPQRTAAIAIARGTGQCGDIIGYLQDTASAGRAVYTTADTQSVVLGRILPPMTFEIGGIAASFVIREARDGWLLVENAGDDTALTERPARPMYSGRGWIRGNGVSVGIQASQAFAEPRFASDIVLQALELHDLESVGEMTELVACEGDWVRAHWTIREPGAVRYSASAVVSTQPLVIEGWSTGICNIQETSCDQPPGDRPEPAVPGPRP